MKRTKCLSCGKDIIKVSFTDHYICRYCESNQGIELNRYAWIDSGIIL